MADVFVRVKESTYVVYISRITPFVSDTVHIYVAPEVVPIVSVIYTVKGEFPWLVSKLKIEIGSGKEQIVIELLTVSQLFPAKNTIVIKSLAVVILIVGG